ncbi:MAG: M48 family metallopeptidase [Spirochaetales bacterium]|nr:M48 family metallopeptidase [Spirochaetales bacterium]
MKKMQHEFIQVRDVKFPVCVYNEKRNSTRVSIGKKAVYIRVPVFMSEKEKIKQISSMIEWARNKLEKHADRFSKRPARIYNDGDILQVGDEEYLLNIIDKDKKTSSARLTDNTITLSVSAHLSDYDRAVHIATLISRCIGKKRLPGLSRKILELNRKYFHMKVGKISFKYQKSRWGSCSTKGNINISTRLLFAPDDVLEYVCIHELAHLIEPNHSKRFWNLVKKALPDYKNKEIWLKQNHHLCRF